MWALIKREVEDTVAYAAIYLVWGAVISGLLIYADVYREKDFAQTVAVLFRFSVITVSLVSAAFGVSQMYLDRTKKISTFLVSHAVGRREVFAARVIAGVGMPLLFYVPAAATLFSIAGREFAYDPGFRFLIFGFVTACGCYSLGLSMGWLSGKIVPSLGMLVLAVILLTLLLMKGFSGEYLVIMGFFFAAAVGRAWQVYQQAAL